MIAEGTKLHVFKTNVFGVDHRPKIRSNTRVHHEEANRILFWGVFQTGEKMLSLKS